MILIRTDEKTRMIIKGHAGYAPAGQDIVCAGISALFGTLREALHKVPETNVLSTDKGALVAFTKRPETVALLFRSFGNGMKIMAEQYPEHIKYERKS